MNWTKALFYMFFLAIMGLGVYFYRFVFSYLIAAMMFSYIMDPFVNWFERRKIPRWTSILIVYFLIVSLLVWFGTRLVPILSAQGNNLIELLGSDRSKSVESLLKLPLISNVNEFLQSLDNKIPNLSVQTMFTDLLQKLIVLAHQAPQLLMDNISKIIGTISFVASVPLLSFFLIKDKYKFRKGILDLIPNRWFELALTLIHKVDFTVGRYIRAMLFEVIAVGIMASIAFSVVGVPNPILVGAIAGFFNIIPYFGPFSGFLVAAMSILITGANPLLVIWAALAMWVTQIIDNNIVYPVVVGTTINMHPLIVLLTVIAGGWIGGILWMLISVPLVFIVYSLSRELYTNLKAFKII